MVRIVLMGLIASALVLGFGQSYGQAQTGSSGVKSAQKHSVDNGAETGTAPRSDAIPNGPRLIVLITSTLIALNQANLTGNYSVFRELSAPSFQIANSVGQLSEIFLDLRHRNFDLSPILTLEPTLVRQPEIASNGMLRVSGFFPTVPERLNFDLIYQRVDGRWLVFGIAVDTTAERPAKATAYPPELPSPPTRKPPHKAQVGR
ncbi:hypothetical protein [Methyloligella solikamskensis]|uniref:Nuclear transport factor 2 family protein n=1 Tax=Methyloligella solikamskensis TaxID=1177756 RepID=A0ABW3J9W0_9HYPH